MIPSCDPTAMIPGLWSFSFDPKRYDPPLMILRLWSSSSSYYLNGLSAVFKTVVHGMQHMVKLMNKHVAKKPYAKSHEFLSV